MPPLKNTLIAATVVLALAAGGWSWWRQQQATEANAGFAHSNGRIEATEVDVATKLAGRVRDILVDEGTQVHAGQVLATMQVATLDAQLREAQAQRQQSLTAVAQAQAQVAMRESDRAAAVAQLRRTEAFGPTIVRSPRGIPAKRIRMSSIESMATPTFPTSPCARG